MQKLKQWRQVYRVLITFYTNISAPVMMLQRLAQRPTRCRLKQLQETTGKSRTTLCFCAACLLLTSQNPLALQSDIHRLGRNPDTLLPECSPRLQQTKVPLQPVSWRAANQLHNVQRLQTLTRQTFATSLIKAVLLIMLPLCPWAYSLTWYQQHHQWDLYSLGLGIIWNDLILVQIQFPGFPAVF